MGQTGVGAPPGFEKPSFEAGLGLTARLLGWEMRAGSYGPTASPSWNQYYVVHFLLGRAKKKNARKVPMVKK